MGSDINQDMGDSAPPDLDIDDEIPFKRVGSEEKADKKWFSFVEKRVVVGYNQKRENQFCVARGVSRGVFW